VEQGGCALAEGMEVDSYLKLELQHLKVLNGLVKHRSLVSLQGVGGGGNKRHTTEREMSDTHTRELAARKQTLSSHRLPAKVGHSCSYTHPTV